MAILKDTILVATATLCVGSALMEIPSESKSFNKFFPYFGTFLSAGIGYYFLRRSNMIKAAEYQPTQEMEDYSLNEIAKSSAIEGFEPMKFSVVGNRAEGLETIFDAEGSFGDKPSLNFSWKSYSDKRVHTLDTIKIRKWAENRRILRVNRKTLGDDKISQPIFPSTTNTEKIDLTGYFDFRGARFYLVKDFHYRVKMKVKKGQSPYAKTPTYYVYVSKNPNEKNPFFELIAGGSSERDMNYIKSKKAEWEPKAQILIRDGEVKIQGYELGRKAVTRIAQRWLYFNLLTPTLAFSFDETIDMADDEYKIEEFQNMIIPYSYKVKDDFNETMRVITNYYYVDEFGECNFLIAISVNEFGMQFLGDTKQEQGILMAEWPNPFGVIGKLQTTFEYRPILKTWLKSVVMDSSNLSKRRINMWNEERDKWFKQQYTPMLMGRYIPLMFSTHNSLIPNNYINYMKACLISSESFKINDRDLYLEVESLSAIGREDIILYQFKKYYSSPAAWKELTKMWIRDMPGVKRAHTQYYNNFEKDISYKNLQPVYSFERTRDSLVSSILDTQNDMNTIVPIGGWFQGTRKVIPLEISNTKSLKVRAFRKLYNKLAAEDGYYDVFDLYEKDKSELAKKKFLQQTENSYYTKKINVMEPTPYSPSNPRSSGNLDDYEGYDMNILKNLLLDNHPAYKSYYNDENEAETFESESSKPHSVTISRSSNSQKKLMAVFEDSEGKKIKTTHFGQRGASDYTKHGDKERMQRYLERHGGGTTTSTKEDWKDPTTAGALSRWILWNKPSLSASFSDYKSRFGLKGTLNVSKSAETFEATEWVGFCPECNKWRTKDMSKIFKNNRKDKNDEEYITDLAFNGWTIPKKLLGKQLCMRGQRFGGNIRNQTDSFTGYGQRTHNNSYCGTPLTKVKSKYKAEYEAKSPAQESLDDWNDEDWKTKSGKPSGETGERFLPTKAIESLTDKEYKETSDKKRKDSKKGKQFSDQPKSIAEKTAKYRTETFEAIEGTGSKARFTDTPDSKVYRDTSLRQKARNNILKGTQGGNAGQWSAIKANLSASKYRTLYENKYGEGKNPYF